MKKVLFLLTVSFLFFSCKKQWTGEHITLTLADIQPQGYPTVIGCQEFANLVNERSQGKIIIQVQTDAPNESDLIEYVHSGKLDFARVSTGPLSNRYPDFQVFSIPFIFRDGSHFWNVMNGPIGTNMLNDLWNYGFVGLNYYESGARSFYFTKPISHIDEFKGVRIRVQNNPMMILFVKALGAVPYPIEYTDVYAAFANNAIQGAENNIPSYWAGKHAEMARYYLLDNHTRIPDILIGSKKTFQALSEEDAALIKKAAQDSVAVQRLAWEEYELAATRAISKQGTVFLAPQKYKNDLQMSSLTAILLNQLNSNYQMLFEEIQHTK
ncbi:MAG: TRAP transporter substrate-binding protein DctP [Treponema sp.]|nr:TRAP transporter substrate-binding protein DctP [Treponema sp.]